MCLSPKVSPSPSPHQCKSSGVVFIKRNNPDNDLQRRVIKSPITALIFSTSFCFNVFFHYVVFTCSQPSNTASFMFQIIIPGFVVTAGQSCARMLILASRSRLYQVTTIESFAASDYTRTTQRTQTGDRGLSGHSQKCQIKKKKIPWINKMLSPEQETDMWSYLYSDHECAYWTHAERLWKLH